MTSRFHRLTLSGVLWLITLVAAEPGLAFQGMQFEAPPPIPGKPNQFSKATGVRVEVDTRWFGMGGGYLPARVKIEARAPQIVARRVEVTLDLSTSQGRWSQEMDESSNSVRFGLTLPANETSVEGTVLCLVPAGWDSVGQLVEVDGRLDAELSFMLPVRVNRKNPGRYDSEPLRVLRPVLKPGQLDRVQRDASFGSSARSWLILGDVKSEPFDDWLAYSAVDVIRLSLTELEAIAKDQPERLTAIRRWVIAGGTLWVERVESDRSAPMEKLALGEIDELLSLQRWQFVASEAEKNPSLGPPAAVYEGDTLIDRADEKGPDELPDSDAVRERVFFCDEAPPWGYLQSETLPPSLLRQASDVLAERKTLFRQTGRLDSRLWYAVRDAGFGKVYAFRQSATIAPRSLPPGIDEVTKQAFREGDWPRRHGLHLGGKSLAFGNLLIPGVGVAPIVEFQVLITLFVLAIGPLNYWLLWRRQQLQMLVITAPLGALAVTLGLFAYAAVADGFGMKARARSLTLLDQTTGEAASWSRVTHYAATPPAEPAKFDGETAIYPITPALDSAMGRMKRSRVIEWEDKPKAGDGSSLQQRLVSGWMPTRTAVQHLLIRSRATPAKLVFTGDGATEVENQLGAPIEWLLIRDSLGDWRQASDIGAGDKAATMAADFSDLAREYRLLNVDNEPQFPIGAGKAIEQTLDRLGATSRRRKSGLSDVELSANLANDRLRELSGLAGGDTLNLPPRSYLAVTRSAVETPLGWENVRELGSFHITVGRW